jgi:hypothetical protein
MSDDEGSVTERMVEIEIVETIHYGGTYKLGHLEEIAGITLASVDGDLQQLIDAVYEGSWRTPGWQEDLERQSADVQGQVWTGRFEGDSPTPVVGQTKPKIEIAVDRDPDGGTNIAVFIDGVEAKWVEDYTVDDVDPGAGYTRTDWDEATVAIKENADFSEAFKAQLLEWRAGYENSSFITDSENWEG